MFSLTDRTAVVAGADGRLGPIWVDALAQAGARVTALCEPGRAPSEALADVVTRGAGAVLLGECDVTDRASVVAARDAVLARDGAIDVLVVNAGIDTPPGPGASWRAGEFPLDLMRHVLEVNLVGAFSVMQEFGRAMAATGRGSIVAIGSMYATSAPNARLYDHIDVDPPFLKPPPYGASKAGLASLVRWLAVHWAPSGVRVNTLSPGGVAGGQDPEFLRKFDQTVPMGRMCEPGELVGPLLFLASDASSYVTGADLLVDGGRHAW
jgi:NAD(P)-dependent dehydrogenase (short-subunit alcohol dehydrogenase family)